MVLLALVNVGMAQKTLASAELEAKNVTEVRVDGSFLRCVCGTR